MNKRIILIPLLLAALAGFFAIRYVWSVRDAHTTFEKYYIFRGCVQLLEKTKDNGTCKLASGQVIKMVKYQNKWYLDGDLPVCTFGICF